MDEKFEQFIDAVLRDPKMQNMRLDQWKWGILSKLWENREKKVILYFGRGNTKSSRWYKDESR